MICWGSGTKPESIPYTFKNLSQTWVALISKPYLPTASLHFGHFPMCWHHLCQLNLGNKSTAEPPALSPEQRHGQGATETPGQGSCWRKRRAMVVGYPAALSPEQWVLLLPPSWRWGLPHQKAWTPQPYLQRLNRHEFPCCICRQCPAQKAIVSVLFSFPGTYQKSNSMMWLMVLYWPTSVVAINTWRNSQMSQPQ